MPRSTLNAAYLLLAGAVIFVFAAAILLFQPLIADISTTRADAAAARARLEERNTFYKNLDQKRITLQAQESNERMLGVALPTDESFADVVRILHRAATAAGGTIADISNATTEAQRNASIKLSAGEKSPVPAGLVPLTVAVKFKGTYQQCRVLLEQLARSPRFMAVESMQAQRDEAALDQLTIELSLRLYQEGGKTK